MSSLCAENKKKTFSHVRKIHNENKNKWSANFRWNMAVGCIYIFP